MTVKVRHYESNKWSHHEDRRYSQEELQKMAAKIRENCKCTNIESCADGWCSTYYVNENQGISFWVNGSFGEISEIIESRSYNGEVK